MPTRRAEAQWNGDLKGGQGTMALGSGAYEGAYSFGSRFEEAPGTNPEELIGAALAGCFSMALSAALGKAGLTPTSIDTQAEVHLNKKGDAFEIGSIDLTTRAGVAGLDAAKFESIAQETKRTCPVSKALAGTTINLKASLA